MSVIASNEHHIPVYSLEEAMETDGREARELARVLDRLLVRFGSTVGPDAIRSVVAEEVDRMRGRPVREFVPLLVERAAAKRLRGCV